uniref:Uncharacterized protein n=1 Tax=Paramoeba aestuarina TaxID=180227 RepID=A0A7S4JX43_9EUKA|mmetsp:Transcript_13775/g.21392  ORF Transcript_13775/g.21392 Transcript_13775/m.21392 type:complete len:358 (+) Transcript_13775:1119-2192(+)
MREREARGELTQQEKKDWERRKVENTIRRRKRVREREKRERRRAEREEIRAEKERERADFSYPISYLTPSYTIKQKLITYTREDHLLPLLNTCANQPILPGKSCPITYDYAQIETGLRSLLLIGKQSLRLQIHHYQYRGEMRGSGRVSGLRRKIPQEDLPNLVLNTICDEFDTQDRVLKFLSRLEMCISFLADTGGEGVKGLAIGSMLLRAYAINTLKIDEEEWEELSTNGVNTHVLLCHLQCLYTKLEETTQQSPLNDVLEKFKAPLSSEQTDQLAQFMSAAPRSFLPFLISVLRDFLTDQLTEDRWDESACLSEYLSYTNRFDEKEEDLLNSLFPEGLDLSVSFETLVWMQNHMN